MNFPLQDKVHNFADEWKSLMFDMCQLLRKYTKGTTKFQGQLKKKSDLHV